MVRVFVGNSTLNQHAKTRVTLLISVKLCKTAVNHSFVKFCCVFCVKNVLAARSNWLAKVI